MQTATPNNSIYLLTKTEIWPIYTGLRMSRVLLNMQVSKLITLIDKIELRDHHTEAAWMGRIEIIYTSTDRHI